MDMLGKTVGFQSRTGIDIMLLLPVTSASCVFVYDGNYRNNKAC